MRTRRGRLRGRRGAWRLGRREGRGRRRRQRRRRRRNAFHGNAARVLSELHQELCVFEAVARDIDSVEPAGAEAVVLVECV